MLRAKARSAALLNSGGVVIKNELNFVTTIALARMLTPAEFGTVSLLALFSSTARPFIDAGPLSELIQKQDATRTDESTVFLFNLGVGSPYALTLYLFTLVIAEGSPGRHPGLLLVWYVQ